MDCVLWGFFKPHYEHLDFTTVYELALLNYGYYPDLCSDWLIFGQTRLIFVGSVLPLPHSRSFRMLLCSLAQ